MSKYSIETVRKFCKKYSNWKRWGETDQLGTLNFITDNEVLEASKLVKKGKVFSLSIPLNQDGPQKGNFELRFNPMHFMVNDGCDAAGGASVRDFFGGEEKYLRSANDIIMMHTHTATHWDALGHINFEGCIYNGYNANYVSSKGALKNGIENDHEKLCGRGVLLDIPADKGVDWLDAGYPITGSDLESAAKKQKVNIKKGDILLIRTGRMARVYAENDWADYGSGPTPGLGLESVDFLYGSEVAAIATDNSGVEVIPFETPDVNYPLHIVLIVKMGLTLGEIFDFEKLAEDCAGDGIYEFFFSGAPLVFTGAVGSPCNPIAIK